MALLPVTSCPSFSVAFIRFMRSAALAAEESDVSQNGRPLTPGLAHGAAGDDPEPVREAVGTLIDGWLKTSEASPILKRFFMTAFQLTESRHDALFHQLAHMTRLTGNFFGGSSAQAHEVLFANFGESFARTAVALSAEGMVQSQGA